MPRWQRAQLAACAGVIGYMLAYVGLDYGRVAHPTYFPLERVWRMADRVPGLASGYFGLWIGALLVAIGAGGAVWIALRWRRTAVGERTLGLVLAWTVTAVVLAAGYYTWNNWP